MSIIDYTSMAYILQVNICKGITVCITCAGNHLYPKPDASIPRQVDAVVKAFLYMSHRKNLGLVFEFSLPCRICTSFA